MAKPIIRKAKNTRVRSEERTVRTPPDPEQLRTWVKTGERGMKLLAKSLLQGGECPARKKKKREQN